TSEPTHPAHRSSWSASKPPEQHSSHPHAGNSPQQHPCRRTHPATTPPAPRTTSPPPPQPPAEPPPASPPHAPQTPHRSAASDTTSPPDRHSTPPARTPAEARNPCPASSSWQGFFDFEVGDGGVGDAEVDLDRPVPGDRFVRAHGVVLD